MQSVSVIIPTLNASQWLTGQLLALHKQTVQIAEIVIVDSQSEDHTCALAAADPLCRVLPIRKADFDHGATRDFAARTSHSDYLWFLTQDAVPADDHCLEELLKALAQDDIACAYARQLASQDATRIEQLNRLLNYPPQGSIRSAEDIASLQIRAFFMSNSCCLYRRDIYEACGGFEHDLPTNEDMLMASEFLRRGYRIAYCATARVYHSHRMTLGQWYRRSFDIGAFTRLYAKQLQGVSAMGAGRTYVVHIVKQLLREGRLCSFLHFCVITVARMLGNRAGQRFAGYSERALLQRTQNPGFWKRYLKNRATAPSAAGSR